MDKMDSFQMLAVMAPVSGLVMVVPAFVLELDSLKRSTFINDSEMQKEASIAILGLSLTLIRTQTRTQTRTLTAPTMLVQKSGCSS